MVTYHDILTVNLQPLSEAIAKWRNLPSHFDEVVTNLHNTVQSPLATSDWEGDTAEAAIEKINSVAKQMKKASEEAKDVHELLDDAYKKFKAAKKKLKDYKETIESSKHLHLDKDGNVSYKPTNLDELSPAEEGLQAKNYSQVVSDYNRYISEAVGNATTADETLAWALNQDFNGRGKGFTGDGYNSIKDAEKGHDKALADLKTLTHLAKDRDHLSLDQLKKANSILSQHEGDPEFSEKFATKVGAKGTLEFWQHAAEGQQSGDERTKTLAKLQKSLGLTLATASHSDSDGMKEWKKDIIKLGPHRIFNTDMNAGTRTEGSYGFQVMSSLLRYGDYDKDFLVDYGKGYKDPDAKDGRAGGLFEFDRKHKEDLKDFYQPDGYETYVSFGNKNADHGKDPMAGYMEALGHNPEASREIFYQDEYDKSLHVAPNSDLKYLLKDREWPSGNWVAKDGKGYGYDELGHALEAASLGHPYDQPELGLHKTAQGANVTTQVISLVADNSGLVEGKPGISDSLARIGAGHIDNLDWSTANNGDTHSGGAIRNAAFGSLEKNDIAVSNETAKNFMSAVGRDEGGYSILSAAQHEFTTSTLKAHPHPGEALTLSLGTGAEVQGILDEARSDSIMSDADDSKEEKARKLSEAGEWQKYSRSSAVSTVTSLVTVPFEAARATPFVTPFVDAATGAIDTQSGIAIDREIERQQKEYDAEIDANAHDAQKKFISLSQSRAANPLDAYIAAHPELDSKTWYNQTSKAIKDGYIFGVGDARLTGSGK